MRLLTRIFIDEWHTLPIEVPSKIYFYSQNLSAGTFALQIGEVSQSVIISAEITPVQNLSSERSDVLDSEQIDNLLAFGRDAMSFVRVLPGVMGNRGGSSLGTWITGKYPASHPL